MWRQPLDRHHRRELGENGMQNRHLYFKRIDLFKKKAQNGNKDLNQIVKLNESCVFIHIVKVCLNATKQLSVSHYGKCESGKYMCDERIS